MRKLMQSAFAALVVVFVVPTAAEDIDTAGIEAVFTEMKEALAARDEARFSAVWVEESYKKNVVGGSGIPGKGVFSQGTRKGWYLKPDMTRVRSAERGSPVKLVPAKVWSIKGNQAVDAVWVAVVWRDKRWLVLGGGEKEEEVLELAKKHGAIR